jgi:tryptophan synthase alpha subunit
VGFPSPGEFYRIVRVAQRLDIMEFGVPSNCPRLDGLTISRAHDVVVHDRGLDTETSLALVGGLRDLFPPRFVMTYAEDGRNYRGFLRSCVRNDIHGVFAPDIGPREARHVASLARAMDLAFVRFVDPAMPPHIVDEASRDCDILYVRVAAGMTGSMATLAPGDCLQLQLLVERARAVNPEILIAGGIGIRDPEQVTTLARVGLDVAIVGTALVENLELGAEQLAAKVDELRQGTLRPPSP